MADNSKREQIIEKIVSNIEAIEDVRTVKREHPSFDDLKQFAPTQFPVVGVLGGLPKPDQDKHYGTNSIGRVGHVKSVLNVELQFVHYAQTDFDKKISYYLDELWAAIHADLTLGGKKWILGITVDPDIQTGIEPPYIAFFMDVSIRYFHDISGI